MTSLFPPPASVPGVPASVAQPVVPYVPPASRFAFPPFVVGPGIPPVSGKLVGSIVAGQFVDLASLLDDPTEPESPVFTFLEDQLVLRQPKKKKEFASVTAWLEAFNVFALVLTAYHPHRISDLLRYSLLILRSATKFPGRGWLAYDVAFRRDAAARGLTDWSSLNAELFHFHASSSQGARLDAVSSSARLPPNPSKAVSRFEPRGPPSSNCICRSWNVARCSSNYAVCRYRHVCDYPRCAALHRRVDAHSVSDRVDLSQSSSAKRPRTTVGKHADQRS